MPGSLAPIPFYRLGPVPDVIADPVHVLVRPAQQPVHSSLRHGVDRPRGGPA